MDKEEVIFKIGDFIVPKKTGELFQVIKDLGFSTLLIKKLSDNNETRVCKQHAYWNFRYATDEEIKKLKNNPPMYKQRGVNRATGKTTREVNRAVELLFERGTIIVPSYTSLISTNGNPKHNGVTAYIIDPQWQQGVNVQRELLDRIKARLNNEHKGQFIVEGNKITIKTEYDNDEL